jgi:hypothetical protein
LLFSTAPDSAILFLLNLFEANVLRASPTSEFSHSLGHFRTCGASAAEGAAQEADLEGAMVALFSQAVYFNSHPAEPRETRGGRELNIGGDVVLKTWRNADRRPGPGPEHQVKNSDAESSPETQRIQQ